MSALTMCCSVLSALFQDTEELLEQLERDKVAVEQVREIVEQEEAIMKKETEVVQSYADVSPSYTLSTIPTQSLIIISAFIFKTIQRFQCFNLHR